MDAKLRQAYLYDFYGELLNEHQRRIYEAFHFQDFSLGEIADEEDISRQGVADVVKRCDRKLETYEGKLHLVEKFLKIKADAKRIENLAAELQEFQPSKEHNKADIFTEQQGQQHVQTSARDRLKQISSLAHGIIEEL